MGNLLTVTEVAQELGYSRNWVYTMFAQGRLTAIEVYGRIFIVEDAKLLSLRGKKVAR